MVLRARTRSRRSAGLTSALCSTQQKLTVATDLRPADAHRWSQPALMLARSFALARRVAGIVQDRLACGSQPTMASGGVMNLRSIGSPQASLPKVAFAASHHHVADLRHTSYTRLALRLPAIRRLEDCNPRHCALSARIGMCRLPVHTQMSPRPSVRLRAPDGNDRSVGGFAWPPF